MNSNTEAGQPKIVDCASCKALGIPVGPDHPRVLSWAEAAALVEADGHRMEARRTVLADREGAQSVPSDSQAGRAVEIDALAIPDLTDEERAGFLAAAGQTGTDEDAYTVAGQALIPYSGDDVSLFEWHECADCPNSGKPCACAGDAYPSEAVRAAVDAALAWERTRTADEIAKLAELRTWATEGLDEMAKNPDVSSGNAISEEVGYANALRTLLDILNEGAGRG